MHRDIWGRHRDDPRPAPRDEPLGDRRDFGQADYSQDYGYDAGQRTGYRVGPEGQDGRDYGQADFGRDYAYDPATRSGYRRTDDVERVHAEEPRSFEHDPRVRRRVAADRVIWALVSERLERARRLDAAYIEVRVQDGVVFLSGTTRTRKGKRMAEDLADVDGVVDVVNGLRLRDR